MPRRQTRARGERGEGRVQERTELAAERGAVCRFFRSFTQIETNTRSASTSASA